jgi:CBS domain-containing protein
MWWPAIGGLIVGLGGLIFPQALGVGYDIIGSILQGKLTAQLILGILLVKSIIWAVSLGSGTSGGVLAPLLMMGGALGGLEALFLPNEGVGFWQLISMGAILGGTMRSPFTGIIFAFELTHDVNALLPLLIAVVIAHGFTVLIMRRSILTEKVSRRGYHLSREYATDPLEILFVREVMRTNIVALSDKMSLKDLAQSLKGRPGQSQIQRLFPVMDAERRLDGVITRKSLQKLIQKYSASDRENLHLAELVNPNPVVAYPDEPLRTFVYRMAETGFTRFPVVDRDDPRKLLGIVSLNDLLKARVRNLEEERHRERVLHVRLLFPARNRNADKVL